MDGGQVEINKQGEAMYDAAFGTFLQAIRQKDPKILRSSFADALKTYEATRWIADASQPTPQSAWNAPSPWVTRAQPSWTNAAAEVIQEAQEQQPEQVQQTHIKPGQPAVKAQTLAHPKGSEQHACHMASMPALVACGVAYASAEYVNPQTWQPFQTAWAVKDTAFPESTCSP